MNKTTFERNFKGKSVQELVKTISDRIELVKTAAELASVLEFYAGYISLISKEEKELNF